ncbi:MAG: hypothetical protein WC676_03955 [Candidatus Omnitrophota bacterium]
MIFQRIILCVFISTFFLLPMAFAHPPSGVELSYDSANGALTVQAEHVSKNPRKHYVRRIAVSKNQEDPVGFSFSSQNSASRVFEQIPFQANRDDVIHAKLICSEAGQSEATITIP